MANTTAFDMNMQIRDLGALTSGRSEAEIRGAVTDLIVNTLAQIVVEAVVSASRDYTQGSANTTRDLPDQQAVDRLTQNGVRFTFQLSTPFGGIGFST